MSSSPSNMEELIDASPSPQHRCMKFTGRLQSLWPLACQDKTGSHSPVLCPPEIISPEVYPIGQPLFTNAYACPPPDGQPLHCPPRVRPIAVITPTHDSLRPTLFYRTYVFLNTTFDRRGCPKTTNLSIHGKGASSFLFGKISAFLKNEEILPSFHDHSDILF